MGAALSFVLWQQIQSASRGLSQWDAILEGRPGYGIFSAANELVPTYGERLLQVGFENAIYFFDGTAIGDWSGPGRYRNLMGCYLGTCAFVAPEEALSVMDTFDANMLAIATARFPRFDRDAYLRRFELLYEDRFGILLVAKSTDD